MIYIYVCVCVCVRIVTSSSGRRRGPGNNVYTCTYIIYNIITNLPIAVALSRELSYDNIIIIIIVFVIIIIIKCRYIYMFTAVMAAVCPGSRTTCAYLGRDFFPQKTLRRRWNWILYVIIIIIIIWSRCRRRDCWRVYFRCFLAYSEVFRNDSFLLLLF